MPARLILSFCLFVMVTTIASAAHAQGGGVFRSVSSELAQRPRGGVIDLFARPNVGVQRSPADLDNWFWRGVAPDRNAAAPRRMEAAGALAATGRYTAPSRARFLALLAQYRAPLQDAAAAHGLSLPFLMSLVMVESGGAHDAISSAGAVGLTQLMPATAELMQVADATDPRDNVMGGARYLAQMLVAHDGDAVLALAAYNAGPGAVARAGGVPLYAETRAYVPRVLAAWHVARQLCETPPVSATGPCEIRG